MVCHDSVSAFLSVCHKMKKAENQCIKETQEQIQYSADQILKFYIGPTAGEAVYEYVYSTPVYFI